MVFQMKCTEVYYRRGASLRYAGMRMRESTEITELLQFELDVASSMHAEGVRGKSPQRAIPRAIN